MRWILIFGFFIFYSSIVFGQTWTGAGDGISWSDANNWNSITIPGPLGIVTISKDSVVVHSGVTALFDSITITSEKTSLSFLNGSKGQGKSIAAHDEATLYNKGQITLLSGRQTGINIAETSRFINTNKITTSNIQGDHIYNEGIIINETGGTIANHNTNKIENAIINIGSFINQGSIVVSDMRCAVTNKGNFTNDGLIQGSQLFHGLSNEGVFHNVQDIIFTQIENIGIVANVMSSFINSGSVIISEVNVSDGILIYSPNFYNTGIIEIDKTSSAGLQIATDAVLNNEESGILRIDDSSLLGIEARGQFNNTGQTFISNTSTGLQVFSGDVNNIGTIRIDTSDRGIMMLGGTLGNIGQMTITETLTGVLMASQGSSLFKNKTQGSLTILHSTVQKQINGNGIFVNESGAAIYYDPQSVSMTVSQGATYENYGTLSQIQQ